MAKRGKPKRYSNSIHQFIISPVEEHSKKPDITRDKIVSLAGDLPRIELFARQKSPGWDVWGNEVGSTIELNSISTEGGKTHGICDSPKGLVKGQIQSSF